MIVSIHGKLHRKGVSKKTEKPYDFWELYCTSSRRGVTGEVSITKTVDPGLFDFETMAVPGKYVIEYDDQGNIFSVANVTAPNTTSSKQ